LTQLVTGYTLQIEVSAAMNEFSDQLAVHRNRLNDEVARGAEHVQNNWLTVSGLIESWWAIFERWEEKDTFNDAFAESRMSVRTFDAGFTKQVSKNFEPGTISVTSTQKDDVEVRMFANSKYKPLEGDGAQEHDARFRGAVESQKYHSQRGIDSSNFAVPENFKSREAKYAAGLHDLSASLLNPKVSIFNQIHSDGKNAHFSFVPLCEEEDQELIFNLTQCAKQLRLMLPALYDRLRVLRASVTRVKLANEFDMGIGYSATPVPDWEKKVGKPAPRGTGIGPKYKPAAPVPAYKLRYGLGLFTTITGPEGQQTVRVTPEIYAARQNAARHFKSILGIRTGEGQKNEIVIAIRKHRGNFPVYATREGEVLKCYNIVDNRGVKSMKLNKKTISSTGVMTG
jgi:hypothetical protein